MNDQPNNGSATSTVTRKSWEAPVLTVLPAEEAENGPNNGVGDGVFSLS